MEERRTLARPYAKAVFEIADKSKAHEKWFQVLVVLAKIAEDPKMLGLVRNRTIAWQDMAYFFLEVTKGILKDVDTLIQNFILALAFYKRLDILPEIKALYETMRAEKENTIAVEVVSASPLNEEEKAKLEIRLKECLFRTVKMQYVIDNNLMGGFIARAGNYVIDGSLQSQLTTLKEAIGD